MELPVCQSAVFQQRRRSFGATCGILRWIKVGLVDLDIRYNLPSLVLRAKLVASAILIDE